MVYRRCSTNNSTGTDQPVTPSATQLIWFALDYRDTLELEAMREGSPHLCVPHYPQRGEQR